LAEAMSSDMDASYVQKCHERESSLPHCNCGCIATESGKVIGWCLHCDHVYADYSSVIEAPHFASNCPGSREQLKKSAQERLTKNRHRFARQDKP
jgi:hypothetical protein